MDSFEAKFMEAQQALRRMSGTMAVVSKQLESAATMLDTVRSMLEDLSYGLPGESRKDVILLQRQCEDWQRRNDKIRTEATDS